MLNHFLIALQFLTRLPVPLETDVSPRELGRSVLFYPVVGLLVGLCLVAVAWLSRNVDADLSAALIVAVWVALTGALHIDGLADTVDAWIGGYGNRERTLAIMKDPFSGPMGVSAVVIVLLLKFAAVAVLIANESWWALLIAPVIGRGTVVALLCWTPYVRPEGLGASQSENLPQAQVPFVLAGCVLLAIIVAGWSVLSGLLIAAIIFYLLRSLMMQRLGGTTGDTAGAVIEVMEVVMVIYLAW